MWYINRKPIESEALHAKYKAIALPHVLCSLHGRLLTIIPKTTRAQFDPCITENKYIANGVPKKTFCKTP